MFRLPHSEISRVAHTEYIGVKSHPFPDPFVKVDSWVSTPNETTRQHGKHPTLALLTLWLVGYRFFEMVAIGWAVFAGGWWRGGGAGMRGE